MKTNTADKWQSIDYKRALIICSWAKKNGCLEKIFKYKCFRPYLAGITLEQIRDRHDLTFDDITNIDDVDSHFEGLHSEATREKLGITYTPPAIREYLIKESLEIFPSHKIPTFCDPACGSGGFLYKAVLLYTEKFGLTVRQCLKDYIYGFDIDDFSIENSKITLLLACLEAQEDPEDVTFHLDALNSLIDTLPLGGFDIICTNPPYVKLQNLSETQRNILESRYLDVATGNYSLSMLFIKRGLELLSDGGILSYITQNNLFTSKSAKNLRKEIQPHLYKIVNFGKEKIFSGVSAYTCLLFLTQKENIKFSYSYNSYKNKNFDFSSDRNDIINTNLNSDKWRLASAKHLANIERIEKQVNSLGDVASIRVGLATLCDKVFVVSGDDIQCHATAAMGGGEIEAGATVAAIKVANLRSSKDLINNSTRIIFPYKKTGKKLSLLEEHEFSINYPKAYAYLETHKERLKKRDKGKGNNPWYAWGRTQGMSAQGPKLLTKTFNKKPQFFFDETDSLFFNGYAVFPHAIGIDILSRILNSRVMHYYAKMTSFEIEGDYQCYQKNFIERFGIPDTKLISPFQNLDDIMFEAKLLEIYNLDKGDLDEVLGTL